MRGLELGLGCPAFSYTVIRLASALGKFGSGTFLTMTAASFLSWRPLRVSDLPRCTELFRADGACGALLDEQLLAKLLRENAIIACVFEEHRPDGLATVRGCGLTGFVATDTAARACRGAIPNLVETLLSSCRGSVPLLLGREQQAQHNAADEAHLVLLNVVVDDSPGSPVEAIEAIRSTAFMDAHRGCGLRTYIVEIRCHERKATKLLQSARGNYPCAPNPDNAATQLYFIDRCLFDAQPHHAWRMLFFQQTPQLALTFAQQDLLVHAMRGDSDDEIAAELCISSETVRKRWASIFVRVNRQLPGLLGNGTHKTGASGTPTRSGEKRRPLLRFLASNPHELRPWA